MENGPAMVLSLEAGKPVEVEEEESLADSLGGGIGLENRYTLSLVQELVDETLLVAKMKLGRQYNTFLKRRGWFSKAAQQSGLQPCWQKSWRFKDRTLL
ncbi:MAG: hypothetical protein CM1200mP28_05270 [Deltaproteobacteria bacterium]|nr:MAG: hypothetical protein CM1200mP28_05270 [Deltaproteobacteria bacterium]